jgi:hypothetical protein
MALRLQKLPYSDYDHEGRKNMAKKTRATRGKELNRAKKVEPIKAMRMTNIRANAGLGMPLGPC